MNHSDLLQQPVGARCPSSREAGCRRRNEHIGNILEEAELARFRAAQDASPQPVDRHFAAAIEELNQLEGQAKRRPGRKKGGDA